MRSVSLMLIGIFAIISEAIDKRASKNQLSLEREVILRGQENTSKTSWGPF